MHCTSCGTEFQTEAKFCSKCGSNLSGELSSGKTAEGLSGTNEPPVDQLNLRDLSGILGKGGIGLFVLSFIWWLISYSEAFKFERSQLTIVDYLQCFYSNNLVCEIYLQEHRVSMPYTSIAMWISVACTVIGAILGSTLSSKK